MGLLRDDRGQAIQVGAAILLGFVVIAITMYQVQVVPAQNAEIEFDHSRSVQDDVQELRNAITNAGARENTESVSVALGARYPARTIFVNPPPARGILRSVDAGNVSVNNATVADGADYDGDAQALLDGEHPTDRILYQPRYNEYGGGPVTVVEHSLAYNAFENATQPLSAQTVVRGDRLTLTIVGGEFEEQGSDSVAIEAETVSGPTDRIPIEPETEGEPIEVDLPVLRPGQWNESIGETYDEGQQGARVAGYDAATEELSIELDGDRYELRMALVGVGGDANETDRYDVGEPGGGGSDAAYEVHWQQDSASVPVGTNSQTFTANTTPEGITGADVDFSFRDPDGVGISEGPGTDTEFTSGTADYEVRDFDNPGTVELFVASGGTSDAMTVDVIGGFLVAITGSNSPVQEGEQLNVTADVENTESTSDTQSVELLIDGSVVDSQSVTLAGGATQSVTLSWQTAAGDGGEHDATVRSEDDSDATTVNVTTGPSFSTLNATVTNERGGGTEANQVTFEYGVTGTPSSITFSVTDATGAGNSQTVTSNFGDPVVIDWGGGGAPQNNYPVTVTADIQGSDCYTAQLQNGTELAELSAGDWSAC